MEIQLDHSDIICQQHSLEIIIIADHLQRPSNYGMLIRMAESMGVKKIHFISDIYTSLTPKMRRSSRSAEQNLKVNFQINSEIIRDYKNDGYMVIGLEYTNQSINVNSYKPPSAKLVLLIGNESAGLSADWIQQSDFCVHLPMYGNNSSMNVVMASGIALWTLIHSM